MEQKYKVDKTSIVGENVQIGEGTRIWQFSNIMSGVTIGENCNIGQNAFIESGVALGNHVTVKNNVALYSGVTCEDDVFLGPNCVFTNVLTPRSFISRKNEYLPTLVKRGATICANATIVCGHTIGEYAMVGAGAVVTKNVQPYTLVVGNPAEKIGYVCQCGERIAKDDSGVYRCKRCGKTYEETESGFSEK
ncbi:MAG: DapH/DapD/GlmU-related protein [Eubacteriales bacterium]|nr:DapH/DapD/GlmU-related protein [Eubacteriales bacterium]